jgi:hypothetical protein
VDYKERILAFFDDINEPVDVEKIRKHCGIGNWLTALSNCLNLFIQGKIRGEKTPKGWIFWTQRERQLEPWEEAIGNYESLRISEDRVTLTLSPTQKDIKIAFPKDSPEAKVLIEAVKNIPKDAKIALLRTDNPERPIIIRTFNDTTVADKIFLPNLWCR